MEHNDLLLIENRIGYNFKNRDLLLQAFVRRSFSAENGGADNEVLEFIGDKVLELSVVRYLLSQYGYMAEECDDFNPQDAWNEFYCDEDEGQLTDLKRQLVEKKMLAHRMDELDLAQYLILGKGDQKKHVQEEASVKEDLFEAILGAVALDCNWDLDTLDEVVSVMLCPELLNSTDEENYVAWIQDWTTKHSQRVPEFHYAKGNYTSTWYCPLPKNWIKQNICNYQHIGEIQYQCMLKIGDDALPIFMGFGKSKQEARYAVCQLAYEYLEKNDLLDTIADEIDSPCLETSINQLEILARRDYFSLPEYTFQETHDADGNPVWHCICQIPEHNKTFSSQSSSKKAAKKDAAWKMLQDILENGGAVSG